MLPHSFVFFHMIVLKACLYELKCLWQILFITRKYSHALLMYKISLPVILSGLMWCLLELGLHLFFFLLWEEADVFCATQSVCGLFILHFFAGLVVRRPPREQQTWVQFPLLLWEEADVFSATQSVCGLFILYQLVGLVVKPLP